MFNQLVCDVQALKTTRPAVFLESQGPVLGCKAAKKGRFKAMELTGSQTQIMRRSNQTRRSMPPTKGEYLRRVRTLRYVYGGFTRTLKGPPKNGKPLGTRPV